MKQEEFDFIKNAFSQILDDIAGNPDWHDAASAVSADLGALERELQKKVVEPFPDLEEEIQRYLRDECSADDEPSVSEIAQHFAEWQKGQMMKEAVEAEVQYFGETQGVPRTIKIPRMQEWLKPFKDGDKVRLIVLKEEEE